MGRPFTQRQASNRRAASEDLKLVKSYGGSKLDQSRAVIGAGLGGKTRNEHFGDVMTRGAEPQRDPRASTTYAHVGMNGAPSIYHEKPGGRRAMRGKRG